MRNWMVRGAVALAAVAMVAPANAYTTVSMGTITPSTPTAFAGDELMVEGDFDLRGLFSVSPATAATSYSTQLVGSGSLSGLTAAIYTDAGGGTIGDLVTTVPASYSNPNAWVFMSPVAFSLAEGSYVFQILGNKTGSSALQYQLAVTAVPLPAAALLFGAGLAVVGGVASRRKRALAQAI
jgi:hypothetical protein